MNRVQEAKNNPDGAEKPPGEFFNVYRHFSSRTMASQLVRQRRLGKLELEPYCETVFAAVLFADISGFTRLSARLSAEELKFHTNQYFTSLLGVVEENHGDTIKFCGDAVMIMWSVDKSADEEVKAAVVLMAAVCALQLLGDCGKYDRGEGANAVSLRLHCGMGCGEVHCMCVGDLNRWEYLISGDPVRQVGQAEPEAGVGEVCLSPEAYFYIQHRLESEVTVMSNHRLTGGLRRSRLRSISTDSNDPGRLSPVLSQDPQSAPHGRVADIALSTIKSTSLDSSFDEGYYLARTSRSAYVGKHSMLCSTDDDAPSSTNTIKGFTSSSASSKGSSAKSKWLYDGEQSVSGYVVPPSSGCFPSCFRAASISPSNRDLPAGAFCHRPPLPTRSQTSGSSGADSVDRRTFIDMGNPKNLLKMNISTDPNTPCISGRSTDISAMKRGLGLDHDPSVKKVRAFLDVLPGDPSVAGNNDSDHEGMTPMLRPFIHEAALNVIESDLLDFGYLAEKRMVVTIFIEVLGLETDFNKGDVRRPQLAMSYVQACLLRFEGSLRQFVVDDKGCVIICAFGLPGSHHEDNCSRAVETAKAIQKSLEFLRIYVKIGIAMGPAYCGLVGSDTRCEYAMMGSSVNLAARLMIKCSPGNILTNDTVYDGACDEFEFEAQEPIEAKGYDTPVTVYRPINRVQSRSSGLGSKMSQHCKFVGRNKDKEFFRERLTNFGLGEDDLERTKGYIIEGPAGIGKTSLLAEIRDLAQADTNISAITIASASASHVSSSYFVVRQIMDAVLSLECFNINGPSPPLTNRSPPLSSRSISKAVGFFSAYADPLRRSDSVSERSESTATPPVSMSRMLSVTGNLNLRIDTSSTFRHPPSPASRRDSPLVSSTTPNSRSVFKRFPSLKLDRKYFTFGGEKDQAMMNSLEILEAWIDSLPTDIMVTELDSIGVFEADNAAARSVSFDAMYSTSGSSGIEKCMLSTIYASAGSIDSDQASVRSPPRTRLTLPMKTLLPLFGDIMSIPCEENAITAKLTPAMRWRMGDALIVQILKQVMDLEKIVFFVENMQWCDFQSLGVLFYFVRDTLGGIFIGTERPLDCLHSCRFRQNGRYDRIVSAMQRMCRITTLPPLLSADIYDILVQVVGMDYLDSFPVLKREETMKQIVGRTAGLPYSVIALCLALREALSENKFVDINRLPSGVHNIIVNRFDQLSTTEKVVLKIASVIGQEFDYHLLRQALIELNCANCTAALFQTLDKLVDAKLIKTTESATTSFNHGNEMPMNTTAVSARITQSVREPERGVFEFFDQSVQNGVYSLMLGSQCELVHGVIGKLLEEKYNDNPEDSLMFAEVVYHYNLSSNLEKKLRYLRLAAKDSEEANDFKMIIYYNSELIKFATNLTLDQLLEKCFGKAESRLKDDDSAVLNQDISANPAPIGVAGDLLVVRNIFGRKTGASHRRAGPAAPSEGWLSLSKALKHFVVTEHTAKLGATKTDVCRWISIVADAETRIGRFHWGHNLSIVALSCLYCSLRVDNSCTGLWKRRLSLMRYPRFWQQKTLRNALSCYENLSFFQLIRGFPEVALSVLQMSRKIMQRNNPVWVSEMSHVTCRLNALHSLACLGCGDSEKATALLSLAVTQNSSNFDTYTSSCVLYIRSFHLAANGLFVNAFDQCMDAARALESVQQFGLQHLVLLSAGWYSFLLGDVAKANSLHHTVFEYGLSMANRPLIKMSMELYAVILIFNSDCTNANFVLDHLKSPLQSGHGNDNIIQPSPIKSSLVAMSCILEKRFAEAIPHIHFSARLLSDMNPTNPICGLYLFFSAYSALEVLLNVEALPETNKEKVLSQMKEASRRSIQALGRSLVSMPSLKLLHMTCVVKQHRLDPDANLGLLNVQCPAVATSATRPSSMSTFKQILHSRSDESSSSVSPPGRYRMWSSASPSTSKLSVEEPLSGTRSWVGLGNIGINDEFALGKLFYHKERAALCEHVHAEKVFVDTTFDSAMMYEQLGRLYNSVFLGDKTRRRAPETSQVSRFADSNGDDIESNNLIMTEVDTSKVYGSEQLDKLRAVEMSPEADLDVLRSDDLLNVLKKYRRGSERRTDQNVSASQRFSPMGHRYKKDTELMVDDSPLMSASPSKNPLRLIRGGM